MASLEWYLKKYGKREGRRKYNDYHRAYRKENAEDLQAYWRKRRAEKKG